MTFPNSVYIGRRLSKKHRKNQKPTGNCSKCFNRLPRIIMVFELSIKVQAELIQVLKQTISIKFSQGFLLLFMLNIPPPISWQVITGFNKKGDFIDFQISKHISNMILLYLRRRSPVLQIHVRVFNDIIRESEGQQISY